MGTLDGVIAEIEEEHIELVENDIIRFGEKTETDRIDSVKITIKKDESLPMKLISKLNLGSDRLSDEETRELRYDLEDLAEKHGFILRPHASSDSSEIYRIETE